MQQQQPMLSTQDFNMAAEIDQRNPDVYHHRGQVQAQLVPRCCRNRRCSSHHFGLLNSQLKILLDQVDDAVGDFDECIRLRPDSALAQAQKCFALVSDGAGSCQRLPAPPASTRPLSLAVFCAVSPSTDKRTPGATRHRSRPPSTALRTSSGGSLNAPKAMLFMLRYRIKAGTGGDASVAHSLDERLPQ